MADGSTVLEKANIRVAADEQMDWSSPFGPDICHGAVATNKQSEMDRILEGTLAGIEYSHKKLSKREKQVLDLILAGNTNREIAKKIYRTERTVEYHRNQLMRKLGTHTSAELVRCAITLGLA